MPNSFESFKKEIQKMLSEAIAVHARIDPRGSIRAGQMVAYQNNWGTIIRMPDKDTPIIKLFLSNGTYINLEISKFKNMIRNQEVRFIK